MSYHIIILGLLLIGHELTAKIKPVHRATHTHIHKIKSRSLKPALVHHAKFTATKYSPNVNLPPPTDIRFMFIVPSYNNAKWYKKNLESIFAQTYKNYHIIYIDDASTDGTAELVEHLITEHKTHDKITLIKNSSRLGIMANRYTAINLCKNTDICIALDGDDWLAHNDVLSLYNKVYQDENIWVTYGNYLEYPSLSKGQFAKALPKSILQSNKIRSHPWSCSHLKTFRTWLFKLIKIESLMMKRAFIPAATDLAMMFPMIEMAKHHSLFVPDITCIYNNANPLGVIRQKNQTHLICNKYLRSKKPYQPLLKRPDIALHEPN